MKKSIDLKVMFDLKGDAEDSDAFAIRIAKEIACRLVKAPKVTTQQIIVIAKALDALERLPESTPWVLVEYGIRYAPEEEFIDVSYLYFRITSDTFEIKRGMLLDSGMGCDDFPDPGWYFDVYGNREADCQLWQLEDEVNQLLGLGGEIYVYDESDAPK